MDKKILYIALASIVAGVILLTAVGKENKTASSNETKHAEETTTQEEQKSEEKQSESKPNPAPGSDEAYVIEYIEIGFVPRKVSIPVGSLVRIENEGQVEIDFASIDNKCPILNLGKIKPKESKSFVVKEVKVCNGRNTLNSAHEILLNFTAAS